MFKGKVTFLPLLAFLTACSQENKLNSEPPKIQLSSNRIVFAGISGNPPRFIDSGPNKGTGWMDYETLEIRKGLKQSGFEIDYDWFTPARIAHEFKAGSPICTWPTKWQNPKQLFSKKPDRLYSIALNFEGDESHTILYHPEDAEKFTKHVDSKGDLKIDSLIHDSSLKTLFVRDFDYGPLGSKLFESSPSGEQTVKEEYKDHVILLLIRDNKQLLEMFNARRFDYIFADSIEPQDYVDAKISKAKFLEKTFKSNRITDIRDPNLIFASVSCSIHPTTLLMMPHLNAWISRTRGSSWISRKTSYRNRIDEKSSRTLSFLYTTLQNLRGQFESGESEFWYPMQQAHFEGLKQFPDSLLPSKAQAPTASSSPKPLKWFFARQKQNQGLIFNASSFSFPRISKNPNRIMSAVRVYPIDLFEAEAFPELTAQQVQEIQTSTTTLSANSFHGLDLAAQPEPLDELTLFAYGLQEADLRRATSLIRSVRKKLTVVGAGNPGSCSLVEALPPQLEELNLTNSSLSECNLREKLQTLPLKKLILTNTQLQPNQVKALLLNLPNYSQSLEVLRLGYNRLGFPKENLPLLKALAALPLRELDLESNYLFEGALNSLTQFLPKTVESLKLGFNHFPPKAIQSFLKRDLPSLRELDLSYSPIGSSISVAFPQKIETLSLAGCHLTPEALDHLKFPKSLKSLDLGDNLLGQDGLQKLLPHLAGRIKMLDLSNTQVKGPSLTALANANSIAEINSLSLSQNGLRDADIKILSTANFRVNHLNLSSNLIRNEGAALLAKRFVPTVDTLNLSENPISELGTQSIALALSTNTRALHLQSLFNLDILFLAEHLPKSLNHLSVGNNQIGNSELKALVAHLPESLLTLSLSNSTFDDALLPPEQTSTRAKSATTAFQDLLSFLGRSNRLVELDLSGTQLTPQGTNALLGSVPQSLRALLFTIDPTLTAPHFNSLPQGLTSLEISGFNHLTGRSGTTLSKNFELAPIFKGLSDSLHTLELAGTPLSGEAIKALASHWPNNLRHLYLSGVKLTLNQFSMLRPLPTLERLALYGADLDDPKLAKLTEAHLDNLLTADWSSNSFSSAAYNRFFNVHSQIRCINISGNQKIDDRLFESLNAQQLQNLRVLFLANTQLSAKGWQRIQSKLDPDLVGLDLSNTKIASNEASILARSLPRNVFWTFLFRGLPLGEAGKTLIHGKIKQNELKSGFLWQIAE